MRGLRKRTTQRASPHGGFRSPQGTRRIGDALTIPLLLALIPCVAALFGWLLDKVFGSFPGLTLALLVLGFIAAGRELWNAATKRDGS
ncbi:MAG TPA: AtpZ/AtpI family protein [bacterium]